MTLGRDELFRRLGYHRQGPGTVPLFELNRSAALVLAEIWDQVLPPGRETACALTALQEALMWANAAVACNLDPNLAELPEVDVADPLDELIERLEGPTMTRSGPVAPSTGPERPDDGPEGAYQVAYRPRRERLAAAEVEHRREVARLDAAGTPEQTR